MRSRSRRLFAHLEASAIDDRDRATRGEDATMTVKADMIRSHAVGPCVMLPNIGRIEGVWSCRFECF